MNALRNLTNLSQRFEGHRAITYEEGWEIIDMVANNAEEAAAEFAEQDKTIAEARRLMLAMFDDANYEKGWVNAKMIQTEKDVRIWLSAHPATESNEE